MGSKREAELRESEMVQGKAMMRWIGIGGVITLIIVGLFVAWSSGWL